jgi:hypothetical protein
MDDRSDTRRVRELLSSGGGARAARYAELERQKQGLRRERDSLLIALARHGGERGLAESLQIPPEVASKLLADARARAGAGPGPEGSIPPGIAADDAEGPWGEADAYYEALGAGPPTAFSRRASWPRPRR